MRDFAKRVLSARSVSVSQAGQDLWVYGEVFNEKRGGYFVDVGAHNGVDISNTYILEQRYGWRGICVEANPEVFVRLARQRRARCRNVCVDRARGRVRFVKNEMSGGILDANTDNRNDQPPAGDVVELETLSLAELLQEEGAPATIDYLSIDIEGAEDRVLLDFDFSRHRFTCMTIERPSAALRARLAANGYVLVREIPHLDGFFVHADFMEEYRTNALAFYSFKKFYFLRYW